MRDDYNIRNLLKWTMFSSFVSEKSLLAFHFGSFPGKRQLFNPSERRKKTKGDFNHVTFVNARFASWMNKFWNRLPTSVSSVVVELRVEGWGNNFLVVYYFEEFLRCVTQHIDKSLNARRSEWTIVDEGNGCLYIHVAKERTNMEWFSVEFNLYLFEMFKIWEFRHFE